jgi:hypothetical protein
MPPLPFSSSLGGVVVVGVELVGVVVVGVVGVVGVVPVVVDPVVVDPVVDPVVVSVAELVSPGVAVTVVSLPPLLAITTTATIRPTMTATRPAIRRRALPWGLCSSGWRIIRVGSSCMV